MVTTNFPDGITNVPNTFNFGAFGDTDPSRYHTFFEDFNRYLAGTSGVVDWLATITQAGSGSPSAVITDENGGVLLVTNDNADNDNYFAQWCGSNSADVAEIFTFTAGKQLWFKTRFKVNDATQSDLVIGLQVTDTSPLAVSDGVYFLKADESTTVNLLATASSTSSTLAVATLASATYVELGFYYDGNSNIYAFVNNVQVGALPVTNLPTTELTVSFGLQNGEAVIKTMNLDFIFVAAER